jgi:exopolysaccharide biosynthesis polyprenyl glycosylphosphotransferase
MAAASPKLVDAGTPGDPTTSDPAAAPLAESRRGPFRPRTLVSTRARRSALLELQFLELADGLVLLAAAIAAMVLGLSGRLLGAPLSQAAPLAVAALGARLALGQFGLYRSRVGDTWRGRMARVGIALGLAVCGAAAVADLAGSLAAVRPALAIFAGLALAALALLHTVAALEFRRWRADGRLVPNVVIVGATADTGRLIDAALARREINILGVFDDRLARSPDAVCGVPVLGDVEALLGHRILPHVDRVAVALDPAAGARTRDIARKLAVLPNETTLLVDLDSEAGCDAALRRLAADAFGSLTGRPEDGRRIFAKRLQDLILGAAALAALSPILALCALAVKLDSPGPIFFRQRRHGFNNETIVVWKFRSLRHACADATAARQVAPGDERVTRVGRILRRLRLDELPQLLNVLTGEMSLVGPRPHAIGMMTGEEESARLVADYALRHRTKPGIAGWAAVNGSFGPLHSAEAVRRRVALDLDYVERQSFWLDLWILALTVPCLLRRDPDQGA